ncbi:hypothetical protein L6164_008877 [Bauhinia variegata]|uniref:Uncharacterized protein n=1 Tax=Bauhinia variegata TaxID=167791 RepID=A0ACB9PHW0_BAUVA|nr:hypothetical protein L6164_008877 [Bauhinia variegata]
MQIDRESYCCQNLNPCLDQVTKYEGLEHLKLIKFMGFTSKEDEISMAKDLIQLVKGKLPRIETSDGACLQCLCREESQRSMETENHLSIESKPFCEFLTEENGVDGSCAKHAHMEV